MKDSHFTGSPFKLQFLNKFCPDHLFCLNNSSISLFLKKIFVILSLYPFVQTHLSLLQRREIFVDLIFLMKFSKEKYVVQLNDNDMYSLIPK